MKYYIYDSYDELYACEGMGDSPIVGFTKDRTKRKIFQNKKEAETEMLEIMQNQFGCGIEPQLEIKKWNIL
jgi:hypothetical protein